MPDKIELLMGDDRPTLEPSVLFNLDRVHHNDEAEVVAMLSLKAPEIDVEKQRTPLNIVAAIDVSTSMGGPKIQNARESLIKLISHLGPDDRLGIIAFNADVFEVYKSNFMTGDQKAAATSAVQKLKARGWTNFSGALLESFEVLKNYEGKPRAVNRIIFFTDGQPSTGEQDPEKILEMLEKGLTDEMSLSTFGYGKDYDAELLTEMSTRGSGNHFGVEDIDKCAAMFGVELGGLLSTFAQTIRVDLELADGVTLLEVLNEGYEVDDGVVKIPDILAGETRHLLAKLKLPKKSAAVCARDTRIVNFNISYGDVQQARRVEAQEVARIRFVRKKADVATEVPQAIQDQLDLIEAARAMTRARRLADSGDLDQARNILRSASEHLAARPGVFTAALCADMGSASRGMSSSRAYRGVRNRLIGSSCSYTSSRTGGGSSLDAHLMNAAQVNYMNLFDGSPDPDGTGWIATTTDDGTSTESSTSDETPAENAD